MIKIICDIDNSEIKKITARPKKGEGVEINKGHVCFDCLLKQFPIKNNKDGFRKE